MKTLHAYITRQVLLSLLITVGVFTFVLLLGSTIKEILPLLVSGRVGFGLVTEAIGLLIPFVLVFALPMGMLTATLLIFGRFSADQELTAVRASGISLLSITTPILLLSLALCAVSALVNMELGPRCRIAYTGMLDDLKLELSSSYLPEGRFVRDFPGYVFFVGKNRRGELEDIWVFRLKDETRISETIRAPRGKLEVDIPNKRINLSLFDGKGISVSEERSIPGNFEEWSLVLDISSQRKGKAEAKVSDMTFNQLWRVYHELERRFYEPVSLQNLSPEQLREKKQAWAKQKKDTLTPVLFHIHRQIAFAFASFGFTLVGIPLAIRVHRRETNVGIAIALVLVLLYYSFLILGHSLQSKPEYAPHLIVWLPNFLFQTIGAVLLWRANRGI